jgi:IS5 family transposase
MRRDPVLAQMETLLDDDGLCQAGKADLVKRFPATATDGRPSTPVEVSLRMLVIKHLYGWSCPPTAHAVSDSLVLRQCCRGSVAPVPDQSTWHRWATLLQPATRHRLLDHLVHLACPLQVTQGRTRRLDGTVGATHIPHPTASTLRYDGVRGLCRAVRKAQARLRETATLPPEAWTDWTLQAWEQRKRRMAVARQRGEAAAERLKTTSRALIDVTTVVGTQARDVQEMVTSQTTAASRRIAGPLAQFLPRVGQGSPQTTRRVMQGEQGPASEKIVRLFEPATAIMRQGKPGKPTEFGRVLWRDEVEGGLSSRDAVLDGNPDEKAPVPLRLAHHRQPFGPPPTLLTGDRGVYSAANERYARTQAVTEVVLPKPGKKSAKRLAYARQEWCRAGRHWRAGIAGRLSGLKRRPTLDRCRYYGTAGLARGVGLGVIVHTLRMIAQYLAA